ncbi:MAG: segregation and condensation protein A [Acidobacteriota bacterium]
MEDSYKIQLEIFEGPLDLLLHLIRREEMDIYNIPIAQITAQYLKYLQRMKDLNITIAGEFVLMASTLIYIKSRTLLPPDPNAGQDEDTLDPRRELVEQLVEHQKFKEAAQMLYARETVELSVWPRGENEFCEEEKEIISAGVFDLIKAFHEMVERFKEQIVIEIEHDVVTLEEKLAEIRRLLQLEREFLFSFFLQRPLSRAHLVVTLLALLELVKLQEVRLFQTSAFEDIRIVKAA